MNIDKNKNISSSLIYYMLKNQLFFLLKIIKVGKSNILLRFVDNRFEANHLTTIGF